MQPGCDAVNHVELPQETCVVGGISVVPANTIFATAQINCGSCRAPARLRRRRHCWHFHCLTHRFRSLAKARQLPQWFGCVRWNWVVPANALSATTDINCGSCRAPARLRRRRYCWHFLRLTLRFRSLAKARQLPQGTGGVRWSWVVPASTMSATTELNCGSCRAPARLRRRRYCWYFRRLTHRFRSLAKARQLPQGTGFCRLDLRCSDWPNSSSTATQLWELSSPSEAAKAAVLLVFSSPDPPLSQPR